MRYVGGKASLLFPNLLFDAPVPIQVSYYCSVSGYSYKVANAPLWYVPRICLTIQPRTKRIRQTLGLCRRAHYEAFAICSAGYVLARLYHQCAKSEAQNQGEQLLWNDHKHWPQSLPVCVCVPIS